jgi:hypothetical protein
MPHKRDRGHEAAIKSWVSGMYGEDFLRTERRGAASVSVRVAGELTLSVQRNVPAQVKGFGVVSGSTKAARLGRPLSVD